MTQSSSSDRQVGLWNGEACGSNTRREWGFSSNKSEASSVLNTILPEQTPLEISDRTYDHLGLADLWQKSTYPWGPDGESFDLLDDAVQRSDGIQSAKLHVQNSHSQQHGDPGTRNWMQARTGRGSRKQPTSIAGGHSTNAKDARQTVVTDNAKNPVDRYTNESDCPNEETFEYMEEKSDGRTSWFGYGDTSNMSPMMEEYFFFTTNRHERHWNSPRNSAAVDSQAQQEGETEGSPRSGGM